MPLGGGGSPTTSMVFESMSITLPFNKKVMVIGGIGIKIGSGGINAYFTQ